MKISQQPQGLSDVNRFWIQTPRTYCSSSSGSLGMNMDVEDGELELNRSEFRCFDSYFSSLFPFIDWATLIWIFFLFSSLVILWSLVPIWFCSCLLRYLSGQYCFALSANFLFNPCTVLSCTLFHFPEHPSTFLFS